MLAPLAFLLAVQEKSPLDRMAEAMAGRKAVSFTMIGGVRKEAKTYRVRLLAPNYYALVGGDNDSHSDGKRAWEVFHGKRLFTERDLAPTLREFGSLPGFGLVFPDAPRPRAGGEPRTEEFFGESAVFVPMVVPSEILGSTRFTAILDPTTWMPRGMRAERTNDPTETYRFEDVVLDPPLEPKDFAYAPPTDYRNLKSEVMTDDAPQVRTMVGPPLAQIVAKPGAWTGGSGISELRLSPKPRIVGKNWVFDIDVKDANGYRWKSASASILVDGKRALASSVAFRPKEKRVVVVVPRIGTKVAPDVLYFEALREDGKAEYVFNFEFKPQSHR